MGIYDDTKGVFYRREQMSTAKLKCEADPNVLLRPESRRQQ